MSLDPGYVSRLEALVRTLATAGKSLRLYPASSPIPRQSVEAVRAALEELFRDGQPVVALTVGRGSFSIGGEAICQKVLGVDELVESLCAHGVAELDITPGCSDEELLGFLTTIARDPIEVRAAGGIAAELVTVGVECIRVTDVQLTVVEHVGPAEDEDFEEFLRNLAKDPEKLAAWFAATATGDPHVFEESLMELVRVSGPSGFQEMVGALSHAFLQQRPEARDALLGLSMDAGPTRDLTGVMLTNLTSNEIAGSIIGGNFGRNMLSLSTALTRLPLEQVTAQVRAEVQAMLPTSGHTAKEAAFLEHMIEVRESAEPEPALIDRDKTYRSVVEAARLTDEVIAQARGAVSASHQTVTAAGVRTMLSLLDQQTDYALFCNSIDSLASLVPKLLEQRDLALASKVLGELSRREALNVGPWPELSERLREALGVAAGPRSMAALLQAVVEDPSRMALAREIVRHAGDAAASSLVAEAVNLKGPGLAAAEELLGRRLIDQLAQIAPRVQWYQLAPIVARLARENDNRSLQTVEALLKRPDEQSRREVATGLSEVGGGIAPRLLATALRDSSPEVAMVAARAIGRSSQPGAASLLGARLGEIDIDNTDFALGREIIAALTRLPGPEADEILAKLASRRTLIRRGRFSEVQDLVSQARAYRAKAGAR